MHLTIRLAGYGGYGVVTSGRILGLSFTKKGFHVLQTESHGAAARGGACTADLTISSDPIYELNFDKPNVLIALSTPAFKKCCAISPDLSSDLLILEADILGEPTVQLGLADLPDQNLMKIYQVRIRRIAEELGHVRYIGIASLGALAAVDDRIDPKLLRDTVTKDDKLRRFKTTNLQALKRGATSISPLKF